MTHAHGRVGGVNTLSSRASGTKRLRITLAGELRQAQPRKTGVILVCESLVHKPTLRQGGPCVEKKLGDIRLGKVAQAGIGVQAASRAGVQRGRGAEIVRY